MLKKFKLKSVTLVVSPKLDKNSAVSFLSLPDPLNYTVTVGLRTSLYCSAFGWPLPKVEWLKGVYCFLKSSKTGVNVTFSDDKIISNSSVLTIIPDAKSENLTYVCRAANVENVASQAYNVRVQRKPYFTKTPTSLSYVNAGIVKLACAAGGLPTPCIQWLKDGKRVKLGARSKIKNGALVMSHTFTSDVGKRVVCICCCFSEMALQVITVTPLNTMGLRFRHFQPYLNWILREISIEAWEILKF